MGSNRHRFTLRVVGTYSALIFAILAVASIATIRFATDRVLRERLDAQRVELEYLRTYCDQNALIPVERFIIEQWIDPARRAEVWRALSNARLEPSARAYQIHKALRALATGEPNIQSVYIYDPASDALISSNEGAFFHFQSSDNPYRRYQAYDRFQAARAPGRRSAWGYFDVFASVDDGIARDGDVWLSYRQALPSTSADAESAFIVVNLKPMARSMGRDALESAVLILDGDARPQHASDPRLIGGTLAPDGALERLRAGDATYIVSRMPSTRGTWQYALAVDPARLLAPVRAFGMLALGAAALVVAATLGLSLLMGRRLFSPLHQVLQRLKREYGLEHRPDDLRIIEAVIVDVNDKMRSVDRMRHENMELMAYKFIADIVFDHAAALDPARAPEALRARLQRPALRLFLVQVHDELIQRLPEEIRDAHMGVAADVIADYWRDAGIINAVVASDRIVNILGLDDPSEADARMPDLLERLTGKLGDGFSIALPESARDPGELRDRYRRADEMMRYAYLYPSGMIVDAERYARWESQPLPFPDANELPALLSLGHTDAIERRLSEYRARVHAVGASLESVQTSMSQVMNAIVRACDALGCLTPPGYERRALSQGLLRAHTLDACICAIDDLLADARRRMSERAAHIHTDHIESIKAYIREHIDEQLSLAVVAEAFHISAGHLSRIFKESASESFLSYVNRCKFERAAVLLRTTALPIADIANTLGYYQPAYFSRLFKEQYGMSPQLFRKQAIATPEMATHTAP